MARKKKVKVKILTFEEILALKVRSVNQGNRILTFDPQQRPMVQAVSDRLTQEFPHLQFRPHPGRVGDWPVIYIKETDQ